MNESDQHLDTLIELALSEDSARNDLTSQLCIAPKTKGKATLIAKQDLRLCGRAVADRIIAVSGWSISSSWNFEDGAEIKNKEKIAEFSGLYTELLGFERTMLNFLQRLSGISTKTAKLVAKAKNFTICDTRKTTPGWRALEKYAVRIGGAKNHRFSMSDMILVKNNHIDANNGNIDQILQAVLQKKPAEIRVEVEVRDLKELEIALKYSVDRIMLDNFDFELAVKAVSIIRGKRPTIEIEFSGNVTEERFEELSKLGVDLVSIGALTHQISAVDMSLRIFPTE